MRANRIFETTLYSLDLNRGEEFYKKVLGLKVASRFNRGNAFRCGRGVLLLFNPELTQIHDRPVQATGAFGSGHVAFAVKPSDLEKWRNHLKQCDVAIETEIDWQEEGRSIYFRDPAGNSIELAPPTLWGFKPQSQLRT